MGRVVNDLTFSADGTRLHTAHTDNRPRTWDVATRSLLDDSEAVVHESPSTTADGPRTAAIVAGGVRITDPATGRTLAEYRGANPYRRVVFSPDGRRPLAFTDDAVELFDGTPTRE